MTETPQLSIRRAQADDLPAIVRLLADDDLGRLRERLVEPLPSSYFAAFTLIDTDPRQHLVVVEQAGTIIGTLQLTVLPGLSYHGSLRAQIESVRVDSRFRGQGIGHQLMTWAIARAREEGCSVVQLTTHNQREDAHRFYTRHGFVASHIGMKLVLS